MRIPYAALLLTMAVFTSVVSLAQAPANDDPCNAITLPLSANETCGSSLLGTTVNATMSTGLGYANPVECGVNSQPQDVWYKVTTTASGAGSTILHFKLTASGASPMASGNITLFRGNGTCPSLTMSLVSGACINSGAAGFTSISFTANFLTPNTTYYLRVNPVRETDAAGTFNVCAYLPVSTPPCVQYISPAPNATNVPVNQFVTFEWTAAPGQFILYDRHLSTSNPPVPTVKSGTATKDSTKFYLYNKKYYWYIAPRNSSGAAVGCPVDSFTTAPAPANCIPLTLNNCRTNDTLKLVKLIGENGTSIDNATGCSGGYADYTGATSVQLAQNKAYAGLLHASFVHDYFTIWIDYNDDGYFTNNERVLNNLKQDWNAQPTPFTINIPATAPVGTHKMRVRNVYYAVNPAVGSRTTDPCDNYDYSETEDYSITIISAASAPAPVVASGANNSCLQAGQLTIDTASNNNTQLVQVVDLSNSVVAAIDANGNDLGIVQVSVYKNAGTVRTLGNGTKVLDRNISIRPQFQPSSPVRVRLYVTSQELAALQGADPTISGINSLAITKVSDTCSTGALPVAGALVSQAGNGPVGADYYIDVTVANLSNFYINGASGALPVGIASFKGERQLNEIRLQWVTATEANNKGFELQRSADGKNFSSIGFVASKALHGNSSAQLQYDYVDVRPMKGSNYYRLKQADRDGNISYSAVVMIKSPGANGIAFTDVYPNPVNEVLKLKIASTALNKADVVITDLAGRVVKQQPVRLVAGDNLVEMNMTNIRAGQYFVKLVCSNGCEGAVERVVKH